MLPGNLPDTPPPDQTAAWRALEAHAARLRPLHLRSLFDADPDRVQAFTLEAEGILLDWSKNRIDRAAAEALFALAREMDFAGWRERLFAGEPVNLTEGRAALHMALRNRSGRPMRVQGEDVMPRVQAELERMRRFAHSVHSGGWKGHTGRPITDVVHIGIGGSELGPRLVVRALEPWQRPVPRVQFVSNMDDADLQSALRGLDPARTLFIVASKTFTTAETLTNAERARRWLVDGLGDAAAVRRHFVAISADARRVAEFGIDEENRFTLWDWVGGRYSLWSAIGLPIVLSLGMGVFEALLEGAHAMDEHFRTAEPEANLPLVLALLGVWYGNFLDADSHAVLPYDALLEWLPAWLQQLDMESCGKGVDRAGRPVGYATGQVIWGRPGTDGQHSFYQYLHQSRRIVPCDFLAAIEPRPGQEFPHRSLLASFLAQPEALMNGKGREAVLAELDTEGMSAEEIEWLVAHRLLPGNRPSNSLLYRRLDAATLGRLLAMYEHKAFAQGVLWAINPFDQWSVEEGKRLSRVIDRELAEGRVGEGHDPSTRALLERCLQG